MLLLLTHIGLHKLHLALISLETKNFYAEGNIYADIVGCHLAISECIWIDTIACRFIRMQVEPSWHNNILKPNTKIKYSLFFKVT